MSSSEPDQSTTIRTPSPAPEAARCPATTVTHGRVLHDDYAWLKTPDWLLLLSGDATLAENIRDYLSAENHYTEQALSSCTQLQSQLQQEMRSRMEDRESELPEKDGPYEYYWRYRSDAEQPVFARRRLAGGEEQILLDGELEANQQDYFELGDYEISPDHRLLAWSADYRGAELPQLRIRDLSTGRDSDTFIANVSTVTWIDSNTLLYARIDEQLRASEVFRHIPGLHAELDSDELIYTEQDPAFEVAVGRMRSGEFVEIVASCDGQDEVWLLPTANASAAVHLLQPRQAGLEYCVDHQGEYFYLLTNAGGADDFQIMRTSVDATALDNWTSWLKPEAGVMILSLDVYHEWIVWLEQRDTLPTVCMQHSNGKSDRLAFNEAAYEIDYEMSPEFDSHSLRIVYESPTTPAQTWHYDMHSGQRRLLKQTLIPAGHNPEDYCVSRLQATSVDGTQVPITCVYHRSTPLNGTAACVLEGYGSYGSSMLADFCSHRLSLLDRGMIYALAHVRGGQEKGRAWYEAAKGALKPNSINDFIACAQALTDADYCRANGIVALGRSAGGLLVAAAVNQAPQSFAAVIADVPFVDVLNTMLDTNHPLTPGEWGQWGNPLESQQAYDWIASYSPYENTRSQAYPAMLISAAVEDPRVGYWEAAKWVARLRALNLGDQPILLHTHFSAGHGGAAGRYESLRDLAREMAFTLSVTGAR